MTGVVGSRSFVHRSPRACDVDHEHAEEIVGQALVLVEQLYVEEVARVPAIQRRVELPAVQILEGENVRLDESEAFRYGLGRRH